jgi:hypothetical protein
METDGVTTKRVIHFRDAVVATCNAVLFTRLPLVLLLEDPSEVFGTLRGPFNTAIVAVFLLRTPIADNNKHNSLLVAQSLRGTPKRVSHSLHTWRTLWRTSRTLRGSIQHCDCCSKQRDHLSQYDPIDRSSKDALRSIDRNNNNKRNDEALCERSTASYHAGITA